MSHELGVEVVQHRVLVGAIAHADAGATGIARQLQVVRGVANHQCALGRGVEFRHQFAQHARVRLAGGFIGGAGGVETRAQRQCGKGQIEPDARLAGGHGQFEAARAQQVEHRQHAVEQHQIVVVLHVVKTIALAQLGILFFGHIGRGVGQRLRQRQADHPRGLGIAGPGAADIDHGGLNAAHDDRGRVIERAVPIEGDQVEIAGALCGHSVSEDE